MIELQLNLPDEDATEQFGRQIATRMTLPFTIYLRGNLGAGKTRLSRAVLHGLGHEGVVKSPTYTLVEPYQLNKIMVYHFDLYRLAEPSELEYMGVRDYFTDNALLLVEWPDRGNGFMKAADLTIELSFAGHGRDCHIMAHSRAGEELLQDLKQNL